MFKISATFALVGWFILAVSFVACVVMNQDPPNAGMLTGLAIAFFGLVGLAINFLSEMWKD